ncbi:Thiol peroxidase [bioreactor metagenome]|uniref:Thiol peroxidase n=1 Tax=bioreactor metagenome TaxID=1076179 RepID=A0A645GYQ4_9ZZZZ
MLKITFVGNPINLLGTEIKVGDNAPNFSALLKDLSSNELFSHENKIKVITVFPSLDTPVCATQVRNFNKELGTISPDVVVLAISNDLPFAQTRFCTTEGIENVVTLSDYRDNEFGLKYGFLIKELKLLARGVVIVDKNNIVKYVEYVPEVTHEVNFEAAIQTVKSLL